MVLEHRYIITYGVYFTNGHYESHTTKVKKCMSEIHAKVKLEEWLKKKHTDFKSLVVYKCVNDDYSLFDFLSHPNTNNFNKSSFN
jgi:hypothetical protein